MAASILASLVLRGSVLRDVVAVSLRLAASVEATGTAPEMVISKKPLFAWHQPDVQGGNDPDVDNPTSGVMPGAGRSRRPHGRLAGRGCPRSMPRGATRGYPAGAQGPR